jgi:inner membrane protein involved in colicin E2 resistance
MTGIIQYETKHGLVSIEVDEAVAEAAGGRRQGDTGLKAKGGYRTASATDGDIIAKAPGKFDEAMATLKAYAGNLADLIEEIEMTPEEVSFEVGLKMTGSAGFIIAKAGAETEMKVALTWKPKSGS